MVNFMLLITFHFLAKNGSGYFCEICNTLFSRLDYVKRHYMEQHANESRFYRCERCQKTFKRIQHLKRHSQGCTIKLECKTEYQQYNCCFCNIWFKEETDLLDHWKLCHPVPNWALRKKNIIFFQSIEIYVLAVKV